MLCGGALPRRDCKLFFNSIRFRFDSVFDTIGGLPNLKFSAVSFFFNLGSYALATALNCCTQEYNHHSAGNIEKHFLVSKWFEPRSISSSCSVIVRVSVVLKMTTDDSEDDDRSGCRNVSHCHQQFFSELHSPGRSHYTNYFLVILKINRRSKLLCSDSVVLCNKINEKDTIRAFIG